MADKYQIEQDKENWAKNLDQALNELAVEKSETKAVTYTNGFVPDADNTWVHTYKLANGLTIWVASISGHRPGTSPSNHDFEMVIPDSFAVPRAGYWDATVPSFDGHVGGSVEPYVKDGTHIVLNYTPDSGDTSAHDIWFHARLTAIG